MHLTRCNALHRTEYHLHRPSLVGKHAVKLGFKPSASVRRSAIRCRSKVQASASVQSNVPAELEKIIGGFSMVPDPKIKYQQLLFYAKKLKPMAAASHTEENKVQGCVSQVWVHPRVDAGKIFWEADSDSALTKGLAALLVQGLSGSTAADIVAIPPDFIDRLGLQQSLTPSRNNGFLNMFRLMQRKSLDLIQTQEHGAQEAADMPKPVPSDSMGQQPIQDSHAELKEQEVREDAHAQQVVSEATTSTESGSGPSGPAGPSGPQAAATSADSSAPASTASSGAQSAAQMSPSPTQAMQTALQETFRPTVLEISQQQHQQSGDQASSNETHLQIHIVSDKLEGMSSGERHKMIEQLLDQELPGSSKTLSLTAQTPAEAQQ